MPRAATSETRRYTLSVTITGDKGAMAPSFKQFVDRAKWTLEQMMLDLPENPDDSMIDKVRVSIAGKTVASRRRRSSSPQNSLGSFRPGGI